MILPAINYRQRIEILTSKVTLVLKFIYIYKVVYLAIQIRIELLIDTHTINVVPFQSCYNYKHMDDSFNGHAWDSSQSQRIPDTDAFYASREEGTWIHKRCSVRQVH